ncbi:hypothetical protein GCM10009760_13840 [Kitasatospora kazusensis]|uniref:Uncharacterized protein n=1 Tax=Kitasatospora kazusensis TaxID=407974 RepID=A0ABN2Z1I7_9ACTN
MTLHRLGKDPNSPDGKSPTVYYDDVTDDYMQFLPEVNGAGAHDA